MTLKKSILERNLKKTFMRNYFYEYLYAFKHLYDEKYQYKKEREYIFVIFHIEKYQPASVLYRNTLENTNICKKSILTVHYEK